LLKVLKIVWAYIFNIDKHFYLLNQISAFNDIVHFTPAPLVLFVDYGWYKPKHEENSQFNLNAGCNFVKSVCILDGEVPEYSQGFFCEYLAGPSNTLSCGPGHKYRGYCDLLDCLFTNVPRSIIF